MSRLGACASFCFEAPNASLHTVLHDAVQSLLEPQSVALIGASERPGRRGTHIWRAVSGSTGIANLWAVNPKYKYVGLTPCRASVEDIPGPIDIAVVALERRLFSKAIASLKKHPAKYVLFAPQEEGLLSDKTEIDELVRAAHDAGMKVLGPNSIGLMNPKAGINLSYWPELAKSGSIAAVAHSGMVAASLVDHAQAAGLGFTAVVDVGLEIDVTLPQMLEHFAEDRATRVIALHVESLRDPRAFASALRAAALVKPVVVLHADSGAGWAADRLAASRFDCGAGSDAGFDALCRTAGAVRVSTFEHFAAAVIALAAAKPAAGRSTPVIANSAGFAELTAGALSRAGLSLAGLSNSTTAALHALRPHAELPVNPIVLGPAAEPMVFAQTLDLILKDPAVENVLIALAPSPIASYAPTTSLIAKAALTSFKPVAIAWTAERHAATIRQELAKVEGSRIIALRGIESAAFGLGVLAEAAETAQINKAPPVSNRRRLSPEALQAVRAVFKTALSANRHSLGAEESAQILQLAGFTSVPFALARTVDEAQTAAQQIGWPVVLKSAASGTSRRTSAGLIFLNLHTPQELQKAWEQLVGNLAQSAPSAVPEGVLIEKMLPHRMERELSLAVRYDAVLGPVIEYRAAGLAGNMPGNAVAALPPLSLPQALSLVDRIEAAKALDGFRGVPPANKLLIALALCRLSDLAEAVPAIREIVLEPVVPFEDQLVVIDGAASLYDAPLEPDCRYSHLTIEAAPSEASFAYETRSGAVYTLRSVLDEDYERLRAFMESLSERTIYLRFHSVVRPSLDRIARFVRLDYSREGAWAAVEEDHFGSERFAAVARWHDLGGGEAEFGVVVRDDRQRQGLASALMALIETQTASRGFSKLVGCVLSGNAGMESLMMRLGYRIDPHTKDKGAEVCRWVKTLSPKAPRR